jgi:hypothetical protein
VTGERFSQCPRFGNPAARSDDRSCPDSGRPFPCLTATGTQRSPLQAGAFRLKSLHPPSLSGAVQYQQMRAWLKRGWRASALVGRGGIRQWEAEGTPEEGTRRRTETVPISMWRDAHRRRQVESI